MSPPSGPSIVVVGSANMDLIGRVPHLPAEGETVLGGDLMHAAGGKGANQAAAAARAGASVAFVGRIGKDAYGEQLRQSLTAADVDLAHLQPDGERPSGVALILVDEDGRNSIAVLPGANAAVSTEDIERARPALRAASIIVLQLEIPIETVIHAAQVGKEMGATILLNPAPARPLPPELLALVDVLVPNRAELFSLAGTSASAGPAEAARRLLGEGVETVVVTLDENGALIVTASAETSVPAYSTRVVDTTGAGDAFVGNLAYS